MPGSIAAPRFIQRHSRAASLPRRGRVSVVVMSEFGRRLRKNDNTDTDHGRGGLMMVLSSNLTRGRAWPRNNWPSASTCA